MYAIDPGRLSTRSVTAGAVLIGDYLDATFFLQRGNALMKQSRGLIVGAGDDIKACANSTGGGGSNSAV